MRLLHSMLGSALLYVSISFFIVQAAPSSPPVRSPVVIKILGINDFHGQLTTSHVQGGRPIGGAAVLASYLHDAETGFLDNTIITMMGDQVGASQPVSGLLDHEPSILFLNTLANSYCKFSNRLDERCNMVATPGNHEFDNGSAAMFDLMYGSNKQPKSNWIPLDVFPGAAFPYISANIVSEETGKTLFPPYIIKNINGIAVAFVGAILKNAASSMLPENARGLRFLDEAEAINHFIPEMKSRGANIIVVIMHQGGDSSPYSEDTRQDAKVNGEIVDLVKNLDDGVDVVMAGHTHRFLNAYLPNRNGQQVLVTQAYSYSTAFAEVRLQVDPQSKKVISKSARIISAFADVYPGTHPDAEAQRIVALAEKSVAPIVNAHVGTLSNDLSRVTNSAGESALGNLIADAYRSQMSADIGVTNSTGIRADLKAGEVTWGHLYSVQPFANAVIKMKFNGQDILDLLEQQWKVQHKNILQVSGISYVYDEGRPVQYRVSSVMVNGRPIDVSQSYTMAVNSFLASGGSGFSVMKRGEIVQQGPVDLDVLLAHVKSLPQPFTAKIDGRIKNKAQSVTVN